MMTVSEFGIFSMSPYARVSPEAISAPITFWSKALLELSHTIFAKYSLLIMSL